MKVFLDTNVIISYLQGNGDLRNLFSKRILEKVQYVISPIVYQEIIFAANQMEKKDLLRTQTDLAKIDNFVKVVSIDTSKIEVESKTMRELRNRLVHANDILILQTAVLHCNYLLTLDGNLLKIGKMDSLKIISPSEYFHVVEARQ